MPTDRSAEMPRSKKRQGLERRNVKRADDAAVKPITVLRHGLAAVDLKAAASSEGEHQRLMVVAALWDVTTFLAALQPPIVSKVLRRHLEALNDLFFHKKHKSLESSVAYGTLPTIEIQVRDGLIAAAVRLLSAGGERVGNYSRDKACRTVAKILNKEGVLDRSKPFAQRRVLNIFLEVTKLKAKIKTAKRDNRTELDLDVVVAAIKDRNRRLTYKAYEAGLAGIKKIEEMIPDSFSTIEKKKKGAAHLIRSIGRTASEAHRFTHPKIEVR
jgi:hypothetical protein